MIRLMRFNAGSAGQEASLIDPAAILAQKEEEMQKKISRAEKFGTKLAGEDEKKKAERMERFGQATPGMTDEQKAKILERKNRFGSANVADKIKSGSLEFTLDEVKGKGFGKKKSHKPQGRTLAGKQGKPNGIKKGEKGK